MISPMGTEVPIAVGSSALAGGFESGVIRVVSRLRTSLDRLFAALPGPVRGGTDLGRALGLGGTLAWHLHGFASAVNPVEAVNLVPGRPSIERLLKASKQKQAPAALIQAVAEAFDEFEAFVQTEAGDRTTFTSMVRGLHEGDSPLDLEAKRDAFRAMSHLLGVQRAVSVGCAIVYPSAQAGAYDFVYIDGSIDLRFLHRADEVCLSRHGATSERRGIETPLQIQSATHGESSHAGIPLLREFCSSPLPELAARRDGSGGVEFMIREPVVGRAGALTTFLAEIVCGAFRPDDDDELKVGHKIMFPTELAMVDVLVTPDLAARLEPAGVNVYANSIHMQRGPRRESDRLSVQERVSEIGTGVGSLHTPAIPRYVDMLTHVCGTLGWDSAVFNAFRCRIEYPVLYSLAFVDFAKR